MIIDSYTKQRRYSIALDASVLKTGPGFIAQVQTYSLRLFLIPEG